MRYDETVVKIDRPRLGRVAQRPRLHGLLDALLTHAQLIWVQGPPGAGKTALVDSWLSQGKRPWLWLALDAGDSDPAVFFRYLHAAACRSMPQGRSRLPNPTPKPVDDPVIFARRYFEVLGARLPANCLIVFDNLDQAGAHSELYPILAAGLEHLRPTVHALCLSRSAQPAPLARLHVSGRLAHLEPGALTATDAEAADVAAAYGITERGAVARIQAQARGWMAGLASMARHHPASPQLLHPYFCHEVLRHIDESARRCMTQSALLPTMSVANVQMLTGCAHSGTILAELHETGCFIERLPSRAPVYQYHPLFRQCLLEQLQQNCPPARLEHLQRLAAHLLGAQGDIVAALTLLRSVESERWPWPIRIRTLGHFAIDSQDGPELARRKESRKPLAMLKLLIALGGEAVPVARLCLALWPDVDGAAARNSFDNALHRLRKLLGGERHVQVRLGGVGLDPTTCWTDLAALDACLDQADAFTPDAGSAPLQALAARALSLFRGDFLAGEDELSDVLGARVRIRAKFVRQMGALGARLEALGCHADALRIYQQVVELQPLAEGMHRRLIACWLALGQQAEAFAAYRHCRQQLSVLLGIQPAPETELLVAPLRHP